MSHIHFIGGEKGGVGKSLLARVLAQHFIDRQLPFVGFDTDRSHGALLRYYADFASPVPLDAHDSLDRVVEAAADQPTRRVLVDLAAQTQAGLVRWLDDAGVAEVCAEIGVGLNYWHVMDAGRDSVDLLASWLDGAGAALPLVLVLNEVRGENFGLLAESGLLERAQARGARTLRLRKLPDALLQKIDGAGISFWAASQPGKLGLLDRQRLKGWLQRTGAEIEALGA
ncbi:Mobilization protein [Rubrivivax sp. A210]|uniref:mobilization protein n=1 Tax=Rubrivivax sp. A210 TaxID=2772301 RepID=UPI001918CE9E|nr:mobilization protein [Rubrivivax sp. A210]CAD5374946.1 Mobilization protein [Rubrivivax sp. A210]